MFRWRGAGRNRSWGKCRNCSSAYMHTLLYTTCTPTYIRSSPKPCMAPRTSVPRAHAKRRDALRLPRRLFCVLNVGQIDAHAPVRPDKGFRTLVRKYPNSKSHTARASLPTSVPLPRNYCGAAHRRSLPFKPGSCTCKGLTRLPFSGTFAEGRTWPTRRRQHFLLAVLGNP